MPKSCKSSAPCTLSSPPVSSPLPPPASALGSSAVSNALAAPVSSSAVLARPLTHSEVDAAGESRPREQSSQSHALFEQFLHFLNSRDPVVSSHSVPSLVQASVSAPFSVSAPSVPLVTANPPTIVPGLHPDFDPLRDSRPFTDMTYYPAPAPRCTSGLRRSDCEGRSEVPPP